MEKQPYNDSEKLLLSRIESEDIDKNKLKAAFPVLKEVAGQTLVTE